jgi:hypothetical protein
MKFDTKIAIVVLDDLATWQKLNVTAFTVSGVIGTTPGILGENYEDASGNTYLPMCIQPMLVFGATAEQIKDVYTRAREQQVPFSLYTEELFSTGHDEANRAAVKAVAAEDLKLVGLAMRGPKKAMDKVLQGLALHK